MMSDRMGIKRLFVQFTIGLLFWGFMDHEAGVLLTTAKEKEKPTKSIGGTVIDSSQNSVIGAKVFIKNLKKNTTTVLITDEKGEFSVSWLDPQVDYEVHAEKGSLSSAVKTVSHYLARKNVAMSLQLVEKGSPRVGAQPEPGRVTVGILSSDGTQIAGDWFQPESKPSGSIPTVLLLHDFGEDRRVWDNLVHSFLLKNNFAALTLDLRGHGASGVKIGSFTQEERQRLVESKALQLDLEAAVKWLKEKDTVDSNHISVIGCGLGASLAFVASGDFDALRSSVAISPDYRESQALSAGIRNFQPHSILYIVSQKGSPNELSVRELEKITGFPVRVDVYEESKANATAILRDVPGVSNAIIVWLKNTM
ncbi:MAG TPA: alpha/beta fold hydrolase [Terriglobia bacterium]|nr:alpha/beta fold hydrolase [Terriglobia bacterium]